MTTERLYGTCIALNGKAAILRGASGSGKSDLALRFIHTHIHNAPKNQKNSSPRRELVADDQILVSRENKTLIARAPEALAGLIEIRGIGITQVPFTRQADIRLFIDLVTQDEVPRLPESSLPGITLLGIKRPLMKLYPFEASAVLKVNYALMQI